MEHSGCEGEEGAADLKPRRGRGVRHTESRKVQDVPRTDIQKRPCSSESDFLSMIRTAINAYYKEIEGTKGEAMFDVEHQRDMARECVLKIDDVLTIWRTQKRAKK